MLTAIIGLASTAITKGIEKANSKISQINTNLTNKKIEELTAMGLIPTTATDSGVTAAANAGIENNTTILFVGIILAVLAIFKR